MEKLKSALTYDEQIDRLVNCHNLLINDRKVAENILKQVGYYRLSGYGIGLKKKGNKEEYIDGTTIESLYRLYAFDSKFKNMLMHIIEQIEIQLRTQISYYLGHKYGPECHKDRSLFDDKISKKGDSVYDSIIVDFEYECERQKRIPFVRHHNDKYDGHFPIWVAVELFTFGNLASLYSIMKSEDQREIAGYYNTSPKHLNGWILSLLEVRNICAHYTRLYNMPLKQAPFLYSENKVYKRGINKVFLVLIVVKKMLDNNKDIWDSFYGEMESLLDEYSDVVRLSYMGFPKNWKEVLK